MAVVGAGAFTFGEEAAVGQGESGQPKVSGSPPTLKEFAASVKVNPELAKAIGEALGGTDDISIEDFAFLEEEEYRGTLNGLVVREAPITPLMKAQAMRLYHQARTQGASAGLPVPGIIAPVKPEGVNNDPAPPKIEHTMLKDSSFLNQASEGVFPLLNPGDLMKYRENYRKLLGMEPPLNQRPTDEQLSALLALLSTGRAPFADFAVFGPFDEVDAKLRKYTDQVFVDGRLQTRLLQGFTDARSARSGTNLSTPQGGPRVWGLAGPRALRPGWAVGGCSKRRC